MALVKDNIIQGVGRLYTSAVGTAVPAYNTGGDSVVADFEDDADWTDLGFTTDGVEVNYEPTYDDIMVDQQFDAAKVSLSSETLSFMTNMREATLRNLAFAWGRNFDSTVAVNGNTQTFSIGVGPKVACEYQLAVVGMPAPGSVENCEPGGDSTVVERIYVAYRVISVQGSNHSLQRDNPTSFPVTFRCLPYNLATAGQEYGKIDDYNVTAATV